MNLIGDTSVYLRVRRMMGLSIIFELLSSQIYTFIIRLRAIKRSLKK